MAALASNTHFLTSHQAAALLGVHYKTLIRWVRKGVITPYQILPTSKYRFLEKDILALLNKKKGGEK
jgi:excisionase family DNA binding protein